MAIHPVDLQTLFTQVDKVGKIQASQREGIAIQQELLGIQSQKKTEEETHSVNKAKDTDEGPEHINDRNARKKRREDSSGKERQNGENVQEKAVSIIQDPALGKNIDVSG
jgi:hypothetical protein